MLRIKQATYLISSADSKNWPHDNVPEICVVGRSNVGKSSFLNAIANNNKLAKIAAAPGKTRLINFFSINKNEFRFVDVPGYGYAKVSQQQKKQFARMMDEYFSFRSNLKAVFLLLDIRHRPSIDDKLMWQYLLNRQCDIYLIATKIDKISKNYYQQQKKILLSEFNIKDNYELIMFSSFTKTGIDLVLEVCEKILQN